MIRLYRLTSGEDVIGTPQESDIAGSLAIKKPFVLIPMQATINKPMQIDFILTYHTQKTKLYTLKKQI